MIDIDKVKRGMRELDDRHIQSLCEPDEEFADEIRRISEIANEHMTAEELSKLIAEIMPCSSHNRHLIYLDAAEKILGISDGHICPVCRKHRFEKNGKYEICPVCGWEDDPVQNDDPYFSGGANEFSLKESRLIYFLEYSCDTDKLKIQFKGDKEGLINVLIGYYCKYTGSAKEEIYKQLYGK